MSPLIRIALTGGIASGKSLAGAFLIGQGIPVIDADDITHGILAHDPEVKTRIRETFGDEVFADDGTVDRKRLGAKVFNAPDKRKLLENWIHPKVREAIERFFQTAAGAPPVAVAIIPLLFEAATEHLYDQVWLIETPEELQIQRLAETRNMLREDALSRIRSQMSLEEKRRRAQAHPSHRIILNTGEPQHLYDQLSHLLETVQAM
jgi:dephospho-CoA kinase